MRVTTNNQLVVVVHLNMRESIGSSFEKESLVFRGPICGAIFNLRRVHARWRFLRILREAPSTFAP